MRSTLLNVEINCDTSVEKFDVTIDFHTYKCETLLDFFTFKNENNHL